ncbi:NAD-binding protein [Candidatus Desantisbacteria bacterium]|nr:NAD-binding protein [Candidatus Desantisbacteria bacterium]
MNIIIVGCGRVGSDLGKMLSVEGHNIIVIDTNPDAFKRLGSIFNGLQIIGSGTDEILLKEAKAEQTDIFIALTDKDNINIMSAQVAKAVFNIPKVIAKINDPDREKVFRGQNFGIISGTHLIASAILNEISNKLYTQCYIISNDTQIVKFTAVNSMINKYINQLHTDENFLISAVIRDNKSHLAIPNLKIRPKDELIAIVKTEFLPQLEEMLLK